MKVQKYKMQRRLNFRRPSFQDFGEFVDVGDDTSRRQTAAKYAVEDRDMEEIILSMYSRDASNRNSYEKMIRELDKYHPREDFIDLESGLRKKKRRRIRKTRTGYFACCQSWRKSDMYDYGEGMTIYFQFIKYMCCLYFLMALMSIPAMLFFRSGNS